MKMCMTSVERKYS